MDKKITYHARIKLQNHIHITIC